MKENEQKGLVKQNIVEYKEANNQMMSGIIESGNIELLLEFCKPIADSQISPYKHESQVAAVALWAYDKGINLMDALANTFLLNGRVALNSHLVRALLQKQGVIHKVIKNFEPVYQYKRQDRIFTQKQVDENPSSFKIFFNAETLKNWAEENPKSTIIPVFQIPDPVDYITTIEFTRWYGREKHTVISSFTMKDAETADLLGKDNWKKYPKQCLFARTYVYGAREIGSDLIFSMYTPEELGSEGLETIIIDEDIEVLDVN